MHVQSGSCPECVVILILRCKWFANWSLLCELWSAYQVGPIKPSISYGACFCRASGCWTRRLCKSSKASWGVIWEDVATPKCVKWFCLSTIAELLGNKGTTHRATLASNAAFISFFFILFLDFAFYWRLGSYLQQQQMFQSKVLNFHQTKFDVNQVSLRNHVIDRITGGFHWCQWTMRFCVFWIRGTIDCGSCSTMCWVSYVAKAVCWDYVPPISESDSNMFFSNNSSVSFSKWLWCWE